MDFVDSEGNIVIPKSVRPIVDLPESYLGSKRGAIKQYRSGSLHIREYENAYSVHVDRISPEHSPLGHLLVDAPEYAIGMSVGLSIGRTVGSSIYQLQRRAGKGRRAAAIDALAAGCLAGVFAGSVARSAASRVKKGCQ